MRCLLVLRGPIFTRKPGHKAGNIYSWFYLFPLLLAIVDDVVLELVIDRSCSYSSIAAFVVVVVVVVSFPRDCVCVCLILCSDATFVASHSSSSLDLKISVLFAL